MVSNVSFDFFQLLQLGLQIGLPLSNKGLPFSSLLPLVLLVVILASILGKLRTIRLEVTLAYNF